MRATTVILIPAVLCGLGLTAGATQVSRAPAGDDNPRFDRLEPIPMEVAEIARAHLLAGQRELQRVRKLSKRGQTEDSKGARAARRERAAYSRAAGEFGMALQLDPDLAAAHLGLGAALRGLGRRAEALEAYAGGLRAAPEDGELMHGWTIALLELDRAEEIMAAHGALEVARPTQAEVLLETLRAWLDHPPEGADASADAARRALAEWIAPFQEESRQSRSNPEPD